MIDVRCPDFVQWNRLKFSEASVPQGQRLIRIGRLVAFGWNHEISSECHKNKKQTNHPIHQNLPNLICLLQLSFEILHPHGKKIHQFHGPSEFLFNNFLYIQPSNLKTRWWFQTFWICLSRTLRKWSNEQWKIPWLVGLYKGFYYTVLWGLS